MMPIPAMQSATPVKIGPEQPPWHPGGDDSGDELREFEVHVTGVQHERCQQEFAKTRKPLQRFVSDRSLSPPASAHGSGLDSLGGYS
jgi:hypothetical protein